MKLLSLGGGGGRNGDLVPMTITPNFLEADLPPALGAVISVCGLRSRSLSAIRKP